MSDAHIDQSSAAPAHFGMTYCNECGHYHRTDTNAVCPSRIPLLSQGVPAPEPEPRPSEPSGTLTTQPHPSGLASAAHVSFTPAEPRPEPGEPSEWCVRCKVWGPAHMYSHTRTLPLREPEPSEPEDGEQASYVAALGARPGDHAEGCVLPWNHYGQPCAIAATVPEGLRERTNAMPLPEPGTFGACYDCGRRYGDVYGFPDLVVPNDVWERISPRGDEGGLLCPSCIVRRCIAFGIECEARFMSGPFAPAPEPRAEPAREREPEGELREAETHIRNLLAIHDEVLAYALGTAAGHGVKVLHTDDPEAIAARRWLATRQPSEQEG